MNKEEYYSRLKKTTSKLLTDRCSFEENHNIALQQIYLKDKYIETLEKENQQLKHNRDKAIEYIEWQKDNPQYDNVWRKYECESLINILKGDSDE